MKMPEHGAWNSGRGTRKEIEEDAAKFREKVNQEAEIFSRVSPDQEDETSELGRSTVPVDLAYLHSLEDDSKRLDKLREAAEETLEWLYGHFPEDDPHIENLRKALEEK